MGEKATSSEKLVIACLVAGPAFFWGWHYAFFNSVWDACIQRGELEYAIFLALECVAAFALENHTPKVKLHGTFFVVSLAFIFSLSSLIVLLCPGDESRIAFMRNIAAALAAVASPLPVVVWSTFQTTDHRCLPATLAGAFLGAHIIVHIVQILPIVASEALFVALPLLSAACWAPVGRSLAASRENTVYEQLRNGESPIGNLSMRRLVAYALTSFLCESVAGVAGQTSSPDAVQFILGIVLDCAFCLTICLAYSKSDDVSSVDLPYVAVVPLVVVLLLFGLPAQGKSAGMSIHLLHTFTLMFQMALWFVFSIETERRGLSPAKSFSAALVVMDSVSIASFLVVIVFAPKLGTSPEILSRVATVVLVALLSLLRAPRPRSDSSDDESSRQYDNGSTLEEKTFDQVRNAYDIALDVRLEEFAALYRLTPREREALGGVLRGMAARQIAQKMCVTTGTVKTHISHAYRKLGVSSRAEAVELFDRGGSQNE
jgi:DNA-binding CsgD family transcriptional regulator